MFFSDKKIKSNYRFFILFIAASLWFYFGFFVFAQAASVGEKIVFNVDSYYDYSGRDSAQSTLRLIGQRGYFYVEDAWWGSLSSAQQSTVDSAIASLSREFDQTIYPKMTSVFGSEWNPGIDNDPKITIFITRIMDDAGGYFSYNDEYPKSKISSSNEREMIYLNGAHIANPRNTSFLAHEFQHMITFYQKQKLRNIEEDFWLNEARSEYASTLLGYDNNFSGSNLEKRAKTFLGRPSDSLTEWRNEIGDYGVVNLFMQYLVEHYGNNLLTLTSQDDKVGIASINGALQKMGRSETFNDIFIRWAIANYMNDCNLDAQKNYCYLNGNLSYSNFHVDPTSSYTLGQGSIDLATWIKDWSPRWYRVDSSSGSARMLQINFESFGSVGNFKVPYILKTDSNAYEINYLSIGADQKGSALFSDFGSRIKSIVLVPINMYKQDSFTSNDPNTPFSLRLTTAVSQPVIFVDGSLVKASNDSKVYLIENSAKRWISSADVFLARGFQWSDIRIVSASDLAAYPENKAVNWPDGSLVKSSQPAVYIISGEKKRPFSSAEAFSGLGYEWKNIKTISQQELDQYELGLAIDGTKYADGTLIRFSDSPSIYLIDKGTKRWIPSVDVFLAKKYNFNLVVIANPSLRGQYPDGTIVS